MSANPWDVVATSQLSGAPGQTPNDPWAITGTTTPAQTATPPGVGAKVLGGAEDLLGVPEAIGTGMLNTPHAFLSGLWDLSQRLSGNAGAPAPAWIESLRANPTAPTQHLASAVDNSPVGQAVGAGVSKVEDAAAPWLAAHPTTADVLHQTGDVAGDVANVVGMGAPAAEGMGALNDIRQSVAAALEQYRNAPIRDTPEGLNAALDRVGYPQLPSKNPNATLPAKVGGMVVGEGPLAQRQTLTAQAVTNALAGHESGVPPNQPVTYSTVQAAMRDGPARVYDAAEQALPEQLTQSPTLQEAINSIGVTASQLPGVKDVDDIKQFMLDQPNMSRRQLFANVQDARFRAGRYLASADPKVQDVGQAYRQLANAYEDFIGDQLNQPGSPVSLADFQKARTQFAKGYSVLGALRTPEATDVDAAAIARQAAKNPGEMTGGLRLIAAQHGRAPLSTGYGPTTAADMGIGRSGDLPGILSREAVAGSLGALFANHFGLPEGAGFGMGMGASYAGMSALRRALSGSPETAAAAARSAATDPRMGAFFGADDELPAGWNRSPPGIRGLLPSPAMVNGGGGVTTASTLADDLGMTPDVARAGAAHPGAPSVPAPSPSPLEGETVPSREPQEIPSTALWHSQPHTELHPTAQITTAEGAPPAGAADQDGIPLAELLSHGLEQPGAAGLSVGPMGTPGGEGLPFHVDPTYAAGDLELADDDRPLASLVDDLHDYAGVKSQGVPEGIMRRSSAPFTPDPADIVGGVTERGGSDAASVGDASPEAISRTAQERDAGNAPFGVNPDGMGYKILHDTSSVDVKAPKGHLKVQIDPTDGKPKILDRGGLSETAARGLLNRYLAAQEQPGKLWDDFMTEMRTKYEPLSSDDGPDIKF